MKLNFLKTLGTLAFSALLAQNAFANSNFAGVKIKEVFADDKGQIRIEIDTTNATLAFVNIPSCARTTTETYYIFDTTTPEGAVWKEMVLDAKAGDKSVKIYGNTTCLTLGSAQFSAHEELLAFMIE